MRIGELKDKSLDACWNLMRLSVITIALLGVAGCTSTGGGAGKGRISEVQTYGNFETAGIIIKVDNLNGSETATLEYREKGASSYIGGHDFVGFDANHLATSLFDLQPDTVYQIRIVLGKKDAWFKQTYSTEVATKKEFQIPVPLRVVAVRTQEQLASALDSIQSGDELRLSAGVTFTGVALKNKVATAKNPIVITSDGNTVASVVSPDATPAFVIDGCEHVIVANLDISAPKAKNVMLLERNYDISIVGSHIHDSAGDKAAGKGTCIISINSDRNPRDGENKSGVYLIMNNTLSHGSLTENVSDAKTSYGGLIDRTYYGIEIESDKDPGPGYVTIRRNTIYGLRDGLSPLPDEGKKPILGPDAPDLLSQWPFREMDVYDNVIFDCTDDAVELDGIAANVRVFRNRIGTCQNAFSTAPMYPGPLFLVKNYAHGFNEGFLKQNTGVPGIIRNVYIYNNTAAMFKTEKGLHGENVLNLGWPAQQRDFVYKNNIFFSRTTVFTGEMSNEPYGEGDEIITKSYHLNNQFDYDLLYSTREFFKYAPLVRWITTFDDPLNGVLYKTLQDFSRATGQEQHGTEGNPELDFTPLKEYPAYSRLVNLAIQGGSAAVDRGTVIPGITNDYKGKAPDCGAFELQ